MPLSPKGLASPTIHYGLSDNSDSPARDALAISAHEIRNPAQALIGLTDMLCAMALPPDAQACARVIRQSADAILAVVDDALDLTRLRQGAIQFVAEPFDPRALIGGTVEILHRQAEAKALDLAGLVAADVPSRVIGDAARIRQILLNFAGNAIKFTDRGGVGITARCEPDGQICFAVEDTGPGLADGQAAALFDAFTTGGHAESGLGLGLAVSAGIANALGGELSVEARDGGGTRFLLRVHCPAVPSDASIVQNGSGDVPVLIISETPFTGPYLTESLIGLGYDAALISRAERAGLWLGGRRDAVLLIDAAIGRRAINAARYRAELAGCRHVALLCGPGEKEAVQGLALPIIRKPESGRATALRIEALRNEANARAHEEQTRPAALVVDDCPINRLLAKRLLTDNGYRVEEAASGLDAIDHVAERLSKGCDHYALILVDLMMPGLDGSITARQIRAVEALFMVPPAFIAALSAHADEATGSMARNEGMDMLVMKPLTETMVLHLQSRATQKHVTQVSETCMTRVKAARARR